MGITQAGQFAIAAQEVTEPLLQPSPIIAVPVVEPPEPPDARDRLLLEILHTLIPDRDIQLHMPPIAATVRRMRLHVIVSVSIAAIMVPVALSLVVRGIVVYVATSRPECNVPLRVWLLGFLLMHLLWLPFLPSVTLLLLGWCVGAVLLVREPDGCKAIWTFLLEALALQTLQAIMLLIGAMSVLSMRSVLRRLRELLDDTGTNPEVIRNITILQPSEIAPDDECVICLSREDEDGALWRQLACGHKYHESCVLEWLAKARHCPICRIDLHHAYTAGAGPMV